MKVGIIGAGTMGSGIAQAFAQTEGYEVCLCDINEEFAANGKKKIAKGFEKRLAIGAYLQHIGHRHSAALPSIIYRHYSTHAANLAIFPLPRSLLNTY